MGSKNSPTAMVSGAGWGAQFIISVSNGLLARGLSHEQIHSLVTDDGKEKLERGIDGFVNALASLFTPTFDLATGKFRWETNYDESIVKKTAVKDPNSFAWATNYATDEKFPDDRKGKYVVSGCIKCFGCEMTQKDVEKWASDNKKILARPKELIDFSKAFPLQVLDEQRSLAAAGQSWMDTDDRCHFLCLSRWGAKRGLDFAWNRLGEAWSRYWWFLVLDK